MGHSARVREGVGLGSVEDGDREKSRELDTLLYQHQIAGQM